MCSDNVRGFNYQAVDYWFMHSASYLVQVLSAQGHFKEADRNLFTQLAANMDIVKNICGHIVLNGFAVEALNISEQSRDYWGRLRYKFASNVLGYDPCLDFWFFVGNYLNYIGDAEGLSEVDVIGLVSDWCVRVLDSIGAISGEYRAESEVIKRMLGGDR